MKTESDGSNERILITKVPLRSLEITRTSTETAFNHSRLPLVIEHEIEHDEQRIEHEHNQVEIGLFDHVKMSFILFPHFLKTVWGLIMKDWKTTITGLLGGVAALINYFTGLIIPQEVIAFITMIAGLYFAGDKNND